MVATHGFQRARRPEQIEARRCAILDAARAMLGSRPVADISLRELSESVGLAKSNVLRYFDSREAHLSRSARRELGCVVGRVVRVVDPDR